MANLFVPYSGSNPAAVTINGHKLLILSRDKDELERNLDLINADHLLEIEGGESAEEQDELLYKLGQTIQGGIIIAPSEARMEEVLESLKSQLPWVH